MDTFWNWWNSLTPAERNGIVAGLITTVAGGLVLSIFTGFWKLVGKALVGTLKLVQKLLNRIWPPAPTEKPPLPTAAAGDGRALPPAAALAPAEKEAQVRALVADALAVIDNYETVAEAARQMRRLRG